jgi:hypothetical protein
MYYFGYCTYLEDAELRKYLPEAVFITKAKAHNYKVEFRAAGTRTDRGWCHLSNKSAVHGNAAQGMVFLVNDERIRDDFDDFDIVFLTVYGDDGKMYDCFTYILSQPGIPMRPPKFYWRRIPAGLVEQNFPPEYRELVQSTYEKAAECPDADRPAPAAKPGRSASTR